MNSTLRAMSILAAMLAGVLAAAIAASTDASNGVRVLYPLPGSSCRGAVRVIAVAPNAQTILTASLDGVKLNLTRKQFSETWQLAGKLKRAAELVGSRQKTSIWTVPLNLTSGTHVLTVGTEKLTIFGGVAPASAGKYSAPLYSHKRLAVDSSGLDCGGCHELIDGRLGEVHTPTACATCHDDTSVQLIHSHVPQHLSRCAQCHDPHGAPYPHLLVDVKKRLCARCHDAGHIK